jgi:hypothetical protein
MTTVPPGEEEATWQTCKSDHGPSSKICSQGWTVDLVFTLGFYQREPGLRLQKPLVNFYPVTSGIFSIAFRRRLVVVTMELIKII